MKATSKSNFKWLGRPVDCYNPGLKKHNGVFYRSCSVNNQKYDVGDFAILEQGSRSAQRRICKLLCMYESCESWHAEARFRGTVRWYPLAERLKISEIHTNVKNEVVEDLRDLEVFISLEQLKQKCFVIFAKPNDPIYSTVDSVQFGDACFTCRFKITDTFLLPIFSECFSPKTFADLNKRQSTSSVPSEEKSYRTHRTPKSKITEETITVVVDGSSGSEELTNEKVVKLLTPNKRGRNEKTPRVSFKRNLNESFKSISSPQSGAATLNYSIIDLSDSDNESIKLKLRLSKKQVSAGVEETPELGTNESSAKILRNRLVGQSTPARRSGRINQRISYAEYISPIKLSPSKRGRSISSSDGSSECNESSDSISTFSNKTEPNVYKGKTSHTKYFSPKKGSPTKRDKSMSDEFSESSAVQEESNDNNSDDTELKLDKEKKLNAECSSAVRTSPSKRSRRLSWSDEFSAPDDLKVRANNKTGQNVRKERKVGGNELVVYLISPSKGPQEENSNTNVTINSAIELHSTTISSHSAPAEIKQNIIDEQSKEPCLTGSSIQSITKRTSKGSTSCLKTPTRRSMRSSSVVLTNERPKRKITKPVKYSPVHNVTPSTDVRKPKVEKNSSKKAQAVDRADIINAQSVALKANVRRNFADLIRKKEISLEKQSIERLIDSVAVELAASTVCYVDILHKRKQSDSNKLLTPKKSKHIGDFGDKTSELQTPKATPRARLKMLREGGFMTPSVQARSTPIKLNVTPLNKAKAQLHVSYVPNALPCREEEFADIYNFVKGKLLDGCGGCMYVSGVPGTGKTATVTEVIKHLQMLVKSQKVSNFKYVNLNGMKLSEPRQSYVEILKQLTGKTLPWEQAQNALETKFTKAQKKLELIVLVVDELDILCTRRQDVVYNLLDWPTRANVPLIIITIANTMDLPERLLMGRVTSRLGLTRLTFQAYTHKQLQEIVTKRLMGINAFNPDAVQLVARKVASVSGDARRALDICRKAAEIAELEDVDAVVSMSHVNKALTAMITQPKVQAIRHCSRLQQLVLQAIVSEVERTGVEETTFLDVFTMLVSVASLDGFQMVSCTVAMAAVSRLGACRLLLLDQKSRDVHQKLVLNVSPDDVFYALRKD